MQGFGSKRLVHIIKNEEYLMFSKPYNFMSFWGVKIGIDLSWIFIAILLTWSLAAGYFPYYYPSLSSSTYLLMGLIGMLGLFGCILLHEMGHALVAKYYKLPISQIILFVFGGVAQIKQEPKSARAEVLMAIAGPIVSVVLVLLMFYLTLLGVYVGWPVQVTGITGYLAMINTVILVFNLLPAFPLDGGHIFRGLLWGWTQNFAWATKIATRVGSGFGFFLIFLGIFFFIAGNLIGGIWLAILGLFLRGAALASQTQFYVGEALHGEKVIKFMQQHPIAVSPNVTIKEFVEMYVYQSHHHIYPVTDAENLVGYVGLNEVKSVPMDKWEATLVKQVMVPFSKLQKVSTETSALDALQLMQKGEASTLFVVDGTRLLGILTAQDLFKTISLKLELESAARR